MTVVATAPASSSVHATAPPIDPVLAALDRIERRLVAVERVAAAIAPAADAVAAVPGGLAMLTDTLDTFAARLADDGVDVDAHLRSFIRALEVSTAPRAVNGLTALIQSKLLEPSSLAVVSRLAAALADPGEVKPVGMWGAMRALRNPDVQRALGFLLAVAREFGRHLASGELAECRDRMIEATKNPALLEAAP